MKFFAKKLWFNLLGVAIGRESPVERERRCWSCDKCEVPCLHHYHQALLCEGCWLREILNEIDQAFWRGYPDQVPPCKHCEKQVPASELESAVCTDWHFCPTCRDDAEVLRYYDELMREMSK